MDYRQSRHGLVRLALLGAMLLCASGAWAQLKPRVLILIDTSGSMSWALGSTTEIRGDGSDDPFWRTPLTAQNRNFSHGSDANGNGLYDDSRIYVVKEAFSQMIYMTGDIEFGLSEFPHSYQTDGTTGPCPYAATHCAGARACYDAYNSTTGNYYYTWNGANSYDDACMKVNPDTSGTPPNYNWLHVPFFPIVVPAMR